MRGGRSFAAWRLGYRKSKEIIKLVVARRLIFLARAAPYGAAVKKPFVHR